MPGCVAPVPVDTPVDLTDPPVVSYTVDVQSQDVDPKADDGLVIVVRGPGFEVADEGAAFEGTDGALSAGGEEAGGAGGAEGGLVTSTVVVVE